MNRLLGAVLLTASIATAQAAPPKPIMWQVSDADNSVYLLGSFHLLRDGDYPLSGSVKAAFDDAEKVFFEVSREEMNDAAKASQLMLKLGMNEKGSTLQSKLKPETWSKFEKYAKTNKLPLANFQVMKPWLVGMVISITELKRAGLKSELGLDKHFMDLAVESKKPTAGLESIESQFQVFNGMTAAQQDEFLEQTLDELGDSTESIDKLHGMWRNGKDKKLLNTMVAEMKKHAPGLYLSLNVNRNLAWVPQIRSFLDDNRQDDAMVVVGSMHLLGDDGVVALLKKEGYKVKRLK